MDLDDRDDERRPLMAGEDRDQDQYRNQYRDVEDNMGTGSDSANRPSNAVATVTAASNNHSHTDAGHPDAPLDNVTTVQVEDSSGTSTPRFMSEQESKTWRWLPYSVRRVGRSIVAWSRGPSNPQPYHIRPFFPKIQEYPLSLVRRFLPQHRYRFWFVLAYLSIWLVTYVLVKRQGTRASEVAGWGTPEKIGCGVTYWGAGNSCGVDGNECRPFSSGGFAFQCNANCESYHLLNPRAVGDQEAIYRSLVVGGPDSDASPGQTVYRGDSFVCAAAIHAGIISNTAGGCGVVRLVGQHQNFASSRRNGITSIAFDSYFPSSFEFVPDVSCSASDNRWSMLAISAVFTGVLSLFTTSPALFFFANFVGIFWTIGTALDPPPFSSMPALFSNILGKFLPAMFCAWVMYDKMGIRRTLGGLTAQVEKTILWLGPCWVGAMDNYTLSFIPLQRLTGHDLQQQPGAKAALSIIVILLTVIVLFQIWFFRKEGRFLKYIRLYAVFIVAILIALLLPGLNLRIHHYILALLLLPGTSIQTRPSLIYQGLLVGLFINGIARWGFASVLETPASLRGDAQKGTALPNVLPPVISMGGDNDAAAANITFKWDAPTQKRYDGISILVNDVERFRSYFNDDFDGGDEFTWNRNKTLDVQEYFRFAFMGGSTSGDYTKAGIWTVDGEWEQMKPGPSRVKVRDLDGFERLRR